MLYCHCTQGYNEIGYDAITTSATGSNRKKQYKINIKALEQ